MTNKKINEIYDKATVARYYETVGKNVESNNENDADKLLHSLIPQNLQDKVVLDLGCGNGRYSEIFCKNGAKKVIAVDLSEAMINQAQERKTEKKLQQLELVRADIGDLPIKKDSLDYIFSRFSLMYTSDLNKVMRKLSDELANGGEMLIETNIVTITTPKLQDNIKKEPISLILTIGDKKVQLKNFAYTFKDYIDAFEKAGLKTIIVEQFPAKNLSIDPAYQNPDDFKFTYGIFKLKKTSTVKPMPVKRN